MSKKVGDGTSTSFRRLFDLASNKLSTVVDIVALGGEVDGEVWGWRRRLRVWEK